MQNFAIAGALTALALVMALPGASLAQQQSAEPRSNQAGVSDQEAASGTSGKADTEESEGVQATTPGAQPAAPATGAVVTETANVQGISLIGQPLLSAEDESIGEIRDVLFVDGRVHGVVVDAGEFLGVGGRTVVIPMDQVSVEGDRIVALQLARTDIEAMPAFEGQLQVHPGDGGGGDGEGGAAGGEGGAAGEGGAGGGGE